MRQVNPWAQLTTVFGMFIAGGFIGWGLSSWAAPGSGLAMAVSGMLESSTRDAPEQRVYSGSVDFGGNTDVAKTSRYRT